jgi:hypothetical protein
VEKKNDPIGLATKEQASIITPKYISDLLPIIEEI